MKLIVGLGNPGRKYENTPHNVGFDVVDRVCGVCGGAFRRSFRFKSLVARVRYRGTEDLLLCKPQKFMNCSGESVAPLLRYYRCAAETMIVVLDDADLSLGRLRIRGQGSSGGHRGVASIIEHVGTTSFTRIKLGIGRGGGRSSLVSHVLGRFDETAARIMGEVTQMAVEAVETVLDSGVPEAMNRYNGWQAPASVAADAEAAGTAEV